MLELMLSSKGGVGARGSGVSACWGLCMQEAKEKTGATGRRGALIGLEAWLEGEGGKGVCEAHGWQDKEKNEDER